MPYLIDTDIIIYSLKNNSTVQRNFIVHEQHPKAISVVSYGELLTGAKKSSRVEKNSAVVFRIKELFPVIPVDLPVMETFSSIKAAQQLRGMPLDDMDLLIAATALTMNYTLVTNNEKHFGKIDGLRVENWSREDEYS